MMQITCTCGKRLRVNDNLAGKLVKCPGCGQPLRVEPEEGNEANRAEPTTRLGETKGTPRPNQKKETRPTPKGSPLPWLLAGGGVFAVAVAALILVLLLKRTPHSHRPTAPLGVGKSPRPASAEESSASVLTEYLGASQLAVSADGTKLATHKDGAIKLWDLGSGKKLASLADSHHSISLALSRDGQFLASSGQEEVCVWDLTTGQIKVKVRTGRSGTVGLSPDNKFAYCIMVNRGIAVVDTTSGAITRLAEKDDAPTAGAFSPVAAVSALSISALRLVSRGKGKRAGAVHTRQDVVMYDLKTGSAIVTLSPFTSPETAFALAFSGDGDFLACGAKDQISLLQYSTRKVVATLDVKGEKPTAKLQVAPQGKFVARLDSGVLTLWNVQAKTSQVVEPSGCLDMAFGPDGLLIVSRSKAPIRVLDPARGTERSAQK